MMTSSTHSFAYSYGLVKKCFLKICEISKFHNFLIFQPISIRFSLFCSENFTLSSEIKFNQLRTTPLMIHKILNMWRAQMNAQLVKEYQPFDYYFVFIFQLCFNFELINSIYPYSLLNIYTFQFIYQYRLELVWLM